MHLKFYYFMLYNNIHINPSVMFCFVYQHPFPVSFIIIPFLWPYLIFSRIKSLITKKKIQTIKMKTNFFVANPLAKHLGPHFYRSKLQYLKKMLLAFFIPQVSFYTPWKHKQTSGFQMFSGDIEREKLHEMG